MSQSKSEPLVEHVLQIPDELLAWGKLSENAVHFSSMWSHDIEAILSRAGDRALRPRETESLFAKLEALCAEAIRAQRGDLLRGLDLLSAELLGLRYRFSTDEGEVEFGRSGQWTYRELRVLLASTDPKRALAAAQQAKALVLDVFPAARIGAIIEAEGVSQACAGCGDAHVVAMVTLSTGSRYCLPCYRGMLRRAPKVEKSGKGERKR